MVFYILPLAASIFPYQMVVHLQKSENAVRDLMNSVSLATGAEKGPSATAEPSESLKQAKQLRVELATLRRWAASTQSPNLQIVVSALCSFCSCIILLESLKDHFSEYSHVYQVLITFSLQEWIIMFSLECALT